jgi:acyl dehydratase
MITSTLVTRGQHCQSDPKTLTDTIDIARAAVLGDRNRLRTRKAAYALPGAKALMAHGFLAISMEFQPDKC